MFCVLICYLFTYELIDIFVFFNDTATTEIYTYCHTLSLHDALPIFRLRCNRVRTRQRLLVLPAFPGHPSRGMRSEEHTSDLQSLMRISYAVFCLKKKKIQKNVYNHN